jgi:hypothetical protein
MNMAFCDGSIHTISYDVDWQVHRDLGGSQRWEPGDIARLLK